ncbi:MAG: aminotransferase class V-fold PLP-dependent enzyme [Acidobacteria bacterium]|nr:aminotransferase class V-fold PLP-dependent enzyme [Acidobacteriota bacterium]
MSCRELFPRAVLGGYLDTAAEGLPAPGVSEAVAEYLGEKGKGTPGRLRHFAVETEARTLAATLLGAPVEDTVFLPTASDALNILAASLPWKPGDRVVTTDLEFPSNVLPWLALRERGVDVQVVASRDGALRLEDLIGAIDNRTRLVTVSQVSYKTGAWFPHTQSLGEAVHAVGGVLCVDATQALGRCRVPLAGVDFLMASTFKWLLGLHGAAVTYMSPLLREKFALAGVGWYSVEDAMGAVRTGAYELKPGAACLVAGMPNFAALYAMTASLKWLLSLDFDVEQKRADQLTRHLRAELAAMGLPLLTPAGDDLTSGIVSFEHPQGDRVMRALGEHGVVVWGGDGRVRASVHYYSDDADIRLLVDALRKVLGA